MARTTRAVGSLSEIADEYDVFILDQYGVMHNGTHAYDGAIGCVDELRQRGKKLAILSNSAKRARATEEKLHAMGLGSYAAYVTGGECAWQLFDTDAADYKRILGKTCVVLAWGDAGGHHLFAEGLGGRLEYAPVETADFVLLLGLGHVYDGKNLQQLDDDALRSTLDRGLARGIPLLCCNPDKVVVKPDGSQSPCPGVLAAYYEDGGGQVLYSGKPHSQVYQMCLRETIGKTGDPSRVVAVGDSLHHDIAGAIAAGIDSVFVTGGVHAEELGIAAVSGEEAASSRLAALYANHLPEGTAPTYSVPAFTW